METGVAADVLFACVSAGVEYGVEVDVFYCWCRMCRCHIAMTPIAIILVKSAMQI